MANHLLRNSDKYRIAVSINNFRELPTDKDFIEAEDDELISIECGCMCCSFGSNLSAALFKLAEMEGRYHHILIEASGMARPEAILGSVELIKSVSSDGVVILVDAETIKKAAFDKYLSDTVLAQLRTADLFV